MELKKSQIHPSPKGKGLLWQEDKIKGVFIMKEHLGNVKIKKCSKCGSILTEKTAYDSTKNIYQNYCPEDFKVYNNKVRSINKLFMKLDISSEILEETINSIFKEYGNKNILTLIDTVYKSDRNISIYKLKKYVLTIDRVRIESFLHSEKEFYTIEVYPMKGIKDNNRLFVYDRKEIKEFYNESSNHGTMPDKINGRTKPVIYLDAEIKFDDELRKLYNVEKIK